MAKRKTLDLPERAITLSEFAKLVGLTSPSAIHGKNGARYEKYITRINSGKGKGNMYISDESRRQFIKDRDNENILIAKCGLFTEYLNKELMITYTGMAKFLSEHTKYTVHSLTQTISSMRFGYEVALAILTGYKKHDCQKIKDFDKYYNW